MKKKVLHLKTQQHKEPLGITMEKESTNKLENLEEMDVWIHPTNPPNGQRR